MRAGLVFALAAVLLAAGCRHDDEAPITREELPRLVLGDTDLGSEWRPFDRGRQVRADGVPGAREDPARFGRIEGWKSRYRRPGTLETPGALVLESRADLFPSSESAADDVEAYQQEFARDIAKLDGKAIESPDIGDEAVGVTFAQPGATRAVRFYRIAWRRENATASLTVNGFEGRIALREALALARKQDARLAEAAES